MCRLSLAVITLFVIGCFLDSLAAEKPKRSKIEEIVKIEFPKEGYSFTLAEAAKGGQDFV